MRTEHDVFVDGSFVIRQVNRIFRFTSRKVSRNKMHEGVCYLVLFFLCLRGGCTAEGSNACKRCHFQRRHWQYCAFHSPFFPPGQNASNEMLVGQLNCVWTSLTPTPFSVRIRGCVQNKQPHIHVHFLQHTPLYKGRCFSALLRVWSLGTGNYTFVFKHVWMSLTSLFHPFRVRKLI